MPWCARRYQPASGGWRPANRGFRFPSNEQRATSNGQRIAGLAKRPLHPSPAQVVAHAEAEQDQQPEKAGRRALGPGEVRSPARTWITPHPSRCTGNVFVKELDSGQSTGVIKARATVKLKMTTCGDCSVWDTSHMNFDMIIRDVRVVAQAPWLIAIPGPSVSWAPPSRPIRIGATSSHLLFTPTS
jgi:hypothetical protein